MGDVPPDRQTELSERSRLVGLLATGVAHDLNNVFTAAYAALDSLQPTGAESRDQSLLRLRASLDRGADLSRWLVAFARTRGGPPDVVDPGLVLRLSEPLFRRCLAHGVELDIQVDPAAGCTLADEGAIERLWLHLLTTLAGASPTPRSGVVLGVRADEAGPRLVARVAGTVLGPTADLRALVDRLGARIEVDDDGTLGVSLRPCRLDDDVDDAGPGPARHILVCDGDDLVRGALTEQLSVSGHAATAAAGRVEALERLARPGQACDLLITDLRLPDGDGPTLVREARATRPDLAVLYTTGGDVPTGLLEGLEAVLLKPYRYGELLAAVARLTSASR